MQRAGQGALFEQFLRLKIKLESEGLFDSVHKRPLPTQPRAIGVVTSLGAAAWHDVMTALQRRVPHIPVLLVPAYYRCRQQCNVVLMGIFDGLKRVKFKPGTDFEVVVFSFDEEESPEIAARKRDELMQVTGRPLKQNSVLQGVYDHRTVAEWNFTVAGKAAIDQICESIGYKFVRDPGNHELLHPAGVVFLTPEGVISHYRMGMNYAPWDLEKDLQLASDNGIGSLVDKLGFVCMKYDPQSGRYSVHVMRLIQAGAVVTILALGGFIFGNRFFGRPKAGLSLPDLEGKR
jgi:cytochrome oxidase Cu insertion factor (SCO1/SenC/PrrC family)